MIKIYTFQFNNADFLEKQFFTFKRFLNEEHQLICINNSFDKPDEREAIRLKAEQLGIPHYIPETRDERSGGYGHQSALNWVWQKFIVQSEDISVFIDHDMFPIKDVPLYPEYDVAAVMQGRGEHIRYFHPGYLLINPSFKDREMVDFRGQNIDGYDCDSGGNIHQYLTQHPDLKIKGLNLVNICEEQENMNILPPEALAGYGDTKPMQILEDFVIHGLAMSNWDWAPEHTFNRKKEILNQTLQHYMNL